MHHCHHPHLQFKQLQHDRPLQFHLPTDPPRCCLEAKHLHQYLSMVSAWGGCADHTYTSAYTSAVLRSEVFNHCQARRLAASSTGINESLPASPQELVAALGWVSPSGHIKLSVVFLICPSRDIGLRYTYSSLRPETETETERERQLQWTHQKWWNVEPVPYTERVPWSISQANPIHNEHIGSGIIYTTVLMSELEVAAPLRTEEAFSISNCVMSLHSNVLK